ncbi:protein HASTY 1 [Tanacetum coccineum]
MSSTVNDVARAIAVALAWNSSPDDRKSALAYLEAVKAGDVRVLASTSFILVKKDWTSEVRLHAFKLLQHLVRLRWEELSPDERREFAKVSIELMNEAAQNHEEWALKSQTAALNAEIVRREGESLWQELLPSLVALCSSGPAHAEMVCMMLRWLPEDITVHNEDLEGERRRLLLRGLTESLPEILPLLYTLLERHFGSAMTEAGRQQFDIAKQHAATVTATLNAINAYAEWAPLPYLSKYGTIHGCGILLSSPDFRLHACVFFKLVSSSRGPSDADSDYDSAMSSILLILFGFYKLAMMMQYFRHYKLELHYQSLAFWLPFIRDLLAKPKTFAGDGSVGNLASGSVQADNHKQRTLSFVNDEICSVILDTSFQRMLKKDKLHPGHEVYAGNLELWNDEFESKGEFSQYRSKLLELVRLTASFKPVIAATKVSDRVIMIIKSLLLAPSPFQNLVVLESMHLAVENVMIAVFDGPNDDNVSASDAQLASCRILEGLLQQLISLKWTEPELIEVLGYYLEAMGPFLNYYPDAVGSVITKLFELLTSLPIVVQDPATSASRYARLHICTSFVRLAKAANTRLLPHMKGIADTVSYLQKEGKLLRGEHNLFGEAFLIIASAAGPQQQQEVMTWLLEPFSHQWMQLEWQNAYLSDPAGVIKLCGETQFMWSLYHTVTFFEKALKRSGIKKSSTNTDTNSSTASSIPHPLASHLSWMLPPLLKLLRAIHSLWSPSVAQILPGEIRAAMSMTDGERTSLLGEINVKIPKGATTFADGSNSNMKDGTAESNETDIRNWLKGIRESGYNVLGLSATVGDAFFKSIDFSAVDLALMENINSMEFRHIRLLVHSIMIPLVKHCPSDLWDVWLRRLLYPLLVYSHQALKISWSGLMDEGRAKVPDLHGIQDGTNLKVEVMEEKLLRDLTREICLLLSVLCSPGLNCGVHPEQSSPKDMDVWSSCLVGFLLKNKDIAIPVLHLCLDAFRWTDADSTSKVASFCGIVVLLAVSTRNIELRQFVCKDLFSAMIQGLALESNALVSATLVGLCSEIYVNFSKEDPTPKQILLSLPCIAPQDLLAFDEALGNTSSSKEHKQLMKSFLLGGTGNQLKALANQKSVNVITNVVARPRSSLPTSESRTEDGGAIGLAAIM